MDNWLFFLIIGIGIVSSFLNKKTKTISQGPISKPQEVEAPSTSYYSDRKEEARRNEPPKRIETKKTDVVQHFEGSRETKKERANKRDTNMNESIKENFTAYKQESNQVAQGMIWSEILGPPRSKRPHSLRHR